MACPTHFGVARPIPSLRQEVRANRHKPMLSWRFHEWLSSGDIRLAMPEGEKTIVLRTILFSSMTLALILSGCSSSSSSSSGDDQKGPCEYEGAHLGCSCTTDASIACSAGFDDDNGAIVQCVNGSYSKSALVCPNSKGCSEPTAGSAEGGLAKGVVNCDIVAPGSSTEFLNFTTSGVPCIDEGLAACSLDLKSIMRCTNGKFVSVQACSGQCAFGGNNEIDCM